MKVGTDCSGIEAPLQALDALGIKYSHEFSSDIDEHVRKSILANYKPKKLYDDITKDRILPKLDLYVCGFPCQSFSLAGNRLGSKDPVKGNIFLHCVKVIKQTEPSVFVLENVPGITSVENGEYWNNVKSILNSILGYNIYYDVLDTKDYGIPQSRKRMYIVGIKTSRMKKEFNFPKKIACKSIKSYVDKSITKQDSLNSDRIKLDNFKGIFIDLSFYNYINENSNIEYCPCLNTRNYIWCVPMHRLATVQELLQLQGFPKNFKQVVSNSQMKKQIGNSMSVNVLVHLFKECFRSIGH
jgi:DNA (cytosine-5)-methyltransferase 1